MAFHSCTPLGPFISKADCYVRVCPVTNPKQIQGDPCAIELLVYNCTGVGIEDQNLLCHLLRLTTCKYWTIDFIIIWITIITRFFNFYKNNKIVCSYFFVSLPWSLEARVLLWEQKCSATTGSPIPIVPSRDRQTSSPRSLSGAGCPNIEKQL